MERFLSDQHPCWWGWAHLWFSGQKILEITLSISRSLRVGVNVNIKKGTSLSRPWPLQLVPEPTLPLPDQGWHDILLEFLTTGSTKVCWKLTQAENKDQKVAFAKFSAENRGRKTRKIYIILEYFKTTQSFITPTNGLTIDDGIYVLFWQSRHGLAIQW